MNETLQHPGGGNTQEDDAYRKILFELVTPIDATGRKLKESIFRRIFELKRWHEVGAPMNIKAENGNTLAYTAYWNGLSEIALFLIKECGADVNYKIVNEITLLNLACTNGNEKFALELIKLGANPNLDNENYQTIDRFYENSSIRDMGREFATHVVLPLLMGNAHDLSANEDDIENITSITLNALSPSPAQWDIKKLKSRTSAEAAVFFHLPRLSRTWHHPAITFPANLRPLLGSRAWHPLMPKDFYASNGLAITCLTSSEQLAEESRQLSHCVGTSDYDQRCCSTEPTRSHLFSVRDGSGAAISTFEVAYNAKGTLELKQHEGLNGNDPPLRAQKALIEWLKAVKEGKVALQTEPLGETEASKQAMKAIPKLHQQIGYVPTEGNINACFDEYRCDKRRASLPTKRRRIAYEELDRDAKDLSHFITGFAEVTADNMPTGRHALRKQDIIPEEGNKLVDLRSLDALSYCRATGMLDAARKYIVQWEPELARALEAHWKAQDAKPLQTRPLPLTTIQVAYAIMHNRLAAQETGHGFVKRAGI